MRESLRNDNILYDSSDLELYRVGTSCESTFRGNIYSIETDEVMMIVDAGGQSVFDDVLVYINKHKGDRELKLLYTHQDPDAAGSLDLILSVFGDVEIFCSTRVSVPLRNYTNRSLKLRLIDTSTSAIHDLKDIGIKIFPAQFLHYAGSLCLYIEPAKAFLSSAIFSAIGIKGALVVEDFSRHKMLMDIFHESYICCGKAAKILARLIEHLDIEMILPQHGSVIPRKFVPDAIEYIRTGKFGLDYLEDL